MAAPAPSGQLLVLNDDVIVMLQPGKNLVGRVIFDVRHLLVLLPQQSLRSLPVVRAFLLALQLLLQTLHMLSFSDQDSLLFAVAVSQRRLAAKVYCDVLSIERNPWKIFLESKSRYGDVVSLRGIQQLG